MYSGQGMSLGSEECYKPDAVVFRRRGDTKLGRRDGRPSTAPERTSDGIAGWKKGKDIILMLPYDLATDKTFPESPSTSSLRSAKQPTELTLCSDRRRAGYITLLPALLVFMMTTGLGITVLAWLSTKCRISTARAFRLGYMLVDEGTTRDDGGVESATLRALTLTSFISTIITATSPILMSLIGYHIARLWIAEQESHLSDLNTGPTPLQYGLMLQVISASSIMSLRDAVSYLCRPRERRPQTPSYFKTTVVLGVVVYAITHLIGLGDLWLHATTKAVLFNVTSHGEAIGPLKTAFVFNQTLCGPYDFDPYTGVCMAAIDGWGLADSSLVEAGQAIVSNSSTDRKIITLADAEDMAVAVPVNVSAFVRFKATTFGMRASCDSLNKKCPHSDKITNCSSMGITAIPSQGDLLSSVALVPPHHRLDGPPIEPDIAIRHGIFRNLTSNPVSTMLQLRWSSQVNGSILPPNPAVDTLPVPAISVYASCRIQVFNATVTYNGAAGKRRAWSLVPEETLMSNDRFTTILIAPYSWQAITDRLATNIQAHAMIADSATDVMARLNQELARLALGYVSGSLAFAPATNVEKTTSIILGRYRLGPLILFVSLLLTYGFICLWVFAVTVNASSSSIHIPQQCRHKSGDKVVASLSLAQLRLLDPLPIVAQLFADRGRTRCGPDEPDALSARGTAMNMFAEHDVDGASKQRLRIGLERNVERPRYGVWKKE